MVVFVRVSSKLYEVEEVITNIRNDSATVTLTEVFINKNVVNKWVRLAVDSRWFSDHL